MENYDGDLGDIIRSGYSRELPPVTTTVNSWQFSPLDDFGHPFSATIRDPLQLNPINTDQDSCAAAGLFSFSTGIDHQDSLINQSKRGDDHMISGGSSSNNCMLENSSSSRSSLQISSSPRNTAGIKRRKGQAKKVVCIPAPTPANSRSTGEIVPSDLWAWRKYGQKPIKGSPYPRGYYRCSSLKGCSARKQVERSRTDPNMLVITYTSEHNHPWPTQRNALAGSTRNTQSGSKNNTINASKNSPSAGSDHQSQKSSNVSNLKEEQKESTNIDIASSSINVIDDNCLEEKLDREMEEELEGDQFSEGFLAHENYRPESIISTSPHDQDLFADLGEINEGADPLKLLFNQGFPGDEISHKGLDSFCFYDWTAGNSNNTNATSYGNQAKMEG